MTIQIVSLPAFAAMTVAELTSTLRNSRNVKTEKKNA
jgi:hypothetical protein